MMIIIAKKMYSCSYFFFKVEGVPGTFIANKYESRGRTKTYITYDKGGNWSLIQAQDEKCQLVSGYWTLVIVHGRPFFQNVNFNPCCDF